MPRVPLNGSNDGEVHVLLGPWTFAFETWSLGRRRVDSLAFHPWPEAVKSRKADKGRVLLTL